MSPIGDAEGTVACDGRQMLVHLPSMERFHLSKAPDRFDVGVPKEAAWVLGPGQTAVQLACEDPYKQLTSSVTAVTRLDDDVLDEETCHRVELAQERYKTVLWIAAGNRPLLRQVEWVLVNLPGTEADEAAETTRPVAKLTNWLLDDEVPSETFVVEIPRDSIQVESLFEADEQAAPHALLGATAPQVELALLDGERRKLVDHRGEQAVVLEFWASWCAPCVEALPALARVGEAFAGRDVAFYAVNVGDEKSDVRAFLSQQGLEIPVALDVDGAVSSRFDANTIPQTFVIDKEGVVQAVHIGFNERIEDALSEELEAILAGEQLAEDALDAARRAHRLGNPIPAGPEAPTSRDLWADTHQFNRRTLIDPYVAAGRRDSAWDDDAIVFLTEVARHFSEAEGFKSQLELIAMAEALTATGCDDP
ncbi:MAG: redoxin domain-containing protein, partial [Planctomycetota bacterium]